MKNGKLRVALVGVSFGAEFVPIYLKHPDVDSLSLPLFRGAAEERRRLPLFFGAPALPARPGPFSGRLHNIIV